MYPWYLVVRFGLGFGYKGRSYALYRTNFRGTIEPKKIGKSTSKSTRKGTGTKGRPVSRFFFL
jgi:hypothetical protein